MIMRKLTHENFIKARDFIFANGDDVTRAWFRYNFVDGDPDAFMKVLGKYQHENGGFGGLLYEFEYQGSCLKCTEHAFRYMFYLKKRPSADDPVVQKMMKYLLERYRPDFGRWGEFWNRKYMRGCTSAGGHIPTAILLLKQMLTKELSITTQTVKLHLRRLSPCIPSLYQKNCTKKLSAIL